MLHTRFTLATLAAIGAALPMAAPLAAQAQPDHPAPAPVVVSTTGIPTSSLAGTTDATTAAQDAVDARHAALTDKRSPDAVDANDAAAHRPAYTYGPVVTKQPVGRTFASVHGAPTSATNTSDDGVDWGEVALIGGTAAGLLAIAGGTLLATQRRSSGRRQQPVA